MHLHHLGNHRTACILDKHDQILAEPLFPKSCLYCMYDRLIGMDRIASAAQDRRIAGLKAESERIRRHIGTGLVNDAHNAQRHTLLADSEPVRPHLHIEHLAHRIIQRRDLPETFRHIGDPFFRKSQPVDQSLLDPFLSRRFQILFVFCKDYILLRDQFLRHREKPSVLIFRTKLRRFRRSGFCASCQHFHICFHVMRSPFLLYCTITI